jgi:hypothetical protein
MMINYTRTKTKNCKVCGATFIPDDDEWICTPCLIKEKKDYLLKG